MNRARTYSDHSKWWIYRIEGGRAWDVSAPSVGGHWPGVTEFATGAEAIAAFARGGVA
jgi:hypothetical protein